MAPQPMGPMQGSHIFAPQAAYMMPTAVSMQTQIAQAPQPRFSQPPKRGRYW